MTGQSRTHTDPVGRRRSVPVWAGLPIALAGAMVLVTIVLLVAAGVLMAPPATWVETVEQGGLFVAVLVFALVGLRLVVHEPRHTVGWILAGIGLALALSGFGGPQMTHRAHLLPVWLHHLSAAGWYVAGAGLVCLLVVMPTGRPLTPPWRVPLLAVGGALTIVAAAGLAAPTIEPSGMSNPWHVPGVHAVASPLAGVAAPVLLLVGAVGGVAALAVRYRRSRGTERLQLKWLLFGGGIFVVAVVTGLPGAIGIGFAALPLSCGVAVARHGLFDVDRVISRTVAYFVLTGLLVALYAVLVVTLRGVLAPIAPESDLAVAGSTLAVAAAFRPARRWVQGVVDRRFHRAQYDAHQAVAAFGQRLRDEVDLQAVAGALTDATRRSLAPAHVAVWLPPARNGPVTASRHGVDMDATQEAAR